MRAANDTCLRRQYPPKMVFPHWYFSRSSHTANDGWTLSIYIFGVGHVVSFRSPLFRAFAPLDDRDSPRFIISFLWIYINSLKFLLVLSKVSELPPSFNTFEDRKYPEKPVLPPCDDVAHSASCCERRHIIVVFQKKRRSGLKEGQTWNEIFLSNAPT